ncbi:MAG: RND family transporter [Planctomycetes bacterium]|nr:RND family transporter [Planctomycetota bacterium]
MTEKGWIPWCAAMILRVRWITLLLVAAITAASGYFASKITIDTSLESWFLEDDATLRLYKQFRQTFGEDEFIVLALEADDVFQPDVLRALHRLTDEAESMAYVRRVTSVTNVEVLRRRGRSLRAAPLMSRLPATVEEAAALREDLSSYPLIAGSLASLPQGRAASVVVELSHDCDTFPKKAAVATELRARAEACVAAADALSHVRVRIAGSPVLSDAISRYIEKDLRTFNPISLLVVMVSIYLMFRRFSVAFMALSVVGLATLWLLGLMGALNVKMNLLGPVLTMVILVVGVADSIHIFSGYYDELECPGTEPREAIERALRHLLVPCCVTNLTTVVGFLSLLTSSLEPIRSFGVLGAIGTSLAFVLSICLLPALLRVFPLAGRPGSRRPVSFVDPILKSLGSPTRRRGWLVLGGYTLVTALGIAAIPRLGVTANPMNYFHEDAPVRQDAEAVDAALGGASSLEFIVHAPNGGLKDLRVLRRLDAFETWLARQPSVSNVMSFGALLKEADRVQRRGGADEGRLPRSNMALLMSKNIMENSAPELLSAYVQQDYSLGRISARVQATNADALASRAGEIEQYVRTTVNGPDLEVQATGFIKLIDDMRKYVIRSQVTSIASSFGTISLVLMLVFRSWRLGLFSLIPNIGPIIIGVAYMAVLGIRLDPGTAMVASIAMGLVVDDTCHFMVRLRGQPNISEDLPAAVAETMRQTGAPIIVSGVILAGGFAVLILGSFSTTVSFGLVASFVLLVALCGEIVVLPAALVVLRPKL